MQTGQLFFRDWFLNASVAAPITIKKFEKQIAGAYSSTFLSQAHQPIINRIAIIKVINIEKNRLKMD